MLDIQTINPINDYHLIQLEDVNESRHIHLGSGRSLGAVRRGKCLRSSKFANSRVMVSHGGIPLNGSKATVLAPGSAIVSVEDILQYPYIHISPIELVRSEVIITLDHYTWSGWYEVLETFPDSGLFINQHVIPIYGTPRLEMEDDTEYIHIDGIGVIQC